MLYSLNMKSINYDGLPKWYFVQCSHASEQDIQKTENLEPLEMRLST